MEKTACQLGRRQAWDPKENKSIHKMMINGVYAIGLGLCLSLVFETKIMSKNSDGYIFLYFFLGRTENFIKKNKKKKLHRLHLGKPIRKRSNTFETFIMNKNYKTEFG